MVEPAPETTAPDLPSGTKWSRNKKLRDLEKQRAQDAAETAAAIVIAADALVISAFGPDCSLTALGPMGQEMVSKPAARLLARLDESTRAAMEKYSDPLILSIGLLMWGAHIYRVTQERGDQGGGPASEPEPEPEPSPGVVAPRSNGYHPERSADGRVVAQAPVDLRERMQPPESF